jgi:hypothetical protein
MSDIGADKLADNRKISYNELHYVARYLYKAVDMSRIDKVISLLVEGAKQYKEHLNNKDFLICYSIEEDIEYKQIAFGASSFRHLAGVETCKSARDFYSACVFNEISTKDVYERSDGTTWQKLTVLSSMKNIVYNSALIGDYDHKGFCLTTDYLVGDAQGLLSLGFKKTEHEYNCPNTLLHRNIRNSVTDAYPVILVASKKSGKKKYSAITYMSNETSLSSIPVTITSMLSVQALAQIKNIDKT